MKRTTYPRGVAFSLEMTKHASDPAISTECEFLMQTLDIIMFEKSLFVTMQSSPFFKNVFSFVPQTPKY